ncbi:hypothetical protein H4S00_006930, partial [Coemansia sp. D1744]
MMENKHMAEIEILVNGKPERALIDTGVQKVFVSVAWCKRNGFTVDPDKRVELTTASLRKTTTVGMAHIGFELGGHSFKECALVLNHPSLGLLLGWPFIEKVGGTISAPARTFSGMSPSFNTPIMNSPLQSTSQKLYAGRVAVSESTFVEHRGAAYLYDSAKFPMASPQSIESRLRMGDGSTAADREAIISMLLKRPMLGREYTPNAPPPLPLQAIELKFADGAAPPHAKQFPISQAAQQQLEDQLENWLAAGICEPAKGN